MHQLFVVKRKGEPRRRTGMQWVTARAIRRAGASSSPNTPSPTHKGGWLGLPWGPRGQGLRKALRAPCLREDQGGVPRPAGHGRHQVPSKRFRKIEIQGASSSLPPVRGNAQERLVLSLIELIQQGVAPWRKPWDGSGGGHHCNLISGDRYRGSNPILLTLGMQIGLAGRPSRCDGSALPLGCGYAEAKALGISLKKGSKAAMILRPQLHQQAEEAEAGQREQAGCNKSNQALPQSFA